MLARFDRSLVLANQFVLGAMMLVMTILVFANVVMRYAGGMSLTWVEELTRYMMIWMAYLGAGLGLRAGVHVAVEILQDMLPGPAVRVLRSVIAVLMLIFFLGLTWYGVQYSLFTMRQTSPVLNLPLGLVYACIPIGCLLLVVHLLLGVRSYVAREPEMFGAADTSADDLPQTGAGRSS